MESPSGIGKSLIPLCLRFLFMFFMTFITLILLTTVKGNIAVVLVFIRGRPLNFLENSLIMDSWCWLQSQECHVQSGCSLQVPWTLLCWLLYCPFCVQDYRSRECCSISCIISPSCKSPVSRSHWWHEILGIPWPYRLCGSQRDLVCHHFQVPCRFYNWGVPLVDWINYDLRLS